MRLRAFTRRLAGREIPKQFCPVIGPDTLLEQTLKRVSLAVPADRTLTVVTRVHEPFYAPLTEDIPASRIVSQPENRGTTAAILYGLLRTFAGGPEDTVAIFPSDHYVDSDERFMSQIADAYGAIDTRPGLALLMGITPEGPETGYGWIDPDGRIPTPDGTLMRVRRFVEKPAAETAQEMFRSGGLWNSFVMIAKVRTLLGMTMMSVPHITRSFFAIQSTIGTRFERDAVARLFAGLPDSNFSHEVLMRHPEALAVSPVTGVHWSDLGDPNRALEVMKRLGLDTQFAAA